MWLNKQRQVGQLPTIQTLDKAHSNIETRTYAISTDIDWLEQKADWAGLKSVIVVENIYQDQDNNKTHQRRYYLSSLTDLHAISEYITNHWTIENCQHWVLDVAFGEDNQKTLLKSHCDLL